LSKLKRGYQAGVGNIKTNVYDPFPKSGLTKQYEPFIRQTVTEFCKQYPRANRQDLLIEAVRLATVAEAKFEPELGNDFSTFARHHLKGLHRYAQREGKATERWVQLDPAAAEEISTRLATGRVSTSSDDEDMSRPASAYLDKATRAAGLRFGWWGIGRTTRVDPRYLLRLYGTPEDRLTGRVAAGLQTILDGPAPVLAGRMRAVIADDDRRRREAEQEAENQRNGDYAPVFLEARPFSPESVSKPSSILIPAAQVRIENDFAELKRPEQRKRLHDLYRGAAAALQPSLSVIEGAVLHWMMRPGGRTQAQMAADIGISKGYASKLVDRLQPQLQEQLRLLILSNVAPK
jgi:DNA-directed RNA polymerase specialized sigma subunit